MIALLRQLAPATAARDESAYWRLVLRYCQQGNLQAVLDEQWHILWDQESCGPRTPTPTKPPPGALANSSRWCTPPRARVHGQFFRAERGRPAQPSRLKSCGFRTVFALRFGHVRTDDGERVSQDAVRAAFNSPFRPFVLARHVD